MPSVRLRAPRWASPNRRCLGGNSPALHTASASWHRLGLNGCLCLQSIRAARAMGHGARPGLAPTGSPPVQTRSSSAFPDAPVLERPSGFCQIPIACLVYPRAPGAANGVGLSLAAHYVWVGLCAKPHVISWQGLSTNAPAERPRRRASLTGASARTRPVVNILGMAATAFLPGRRVGSSGQESGSLSLSRHTDTPSSEAQGRCAYYSNKNARLSLLIWCFIEVFSPT